MERIRELRRLIDEIDREIIKLLDRRMEIVHEIGRVKKLYGVSIKDGSREKEVLARAGRYADVFREIIKASINVQKNMFSIKKTKRNKRDVKRIGIVGYGKMGRLFAEIFSEDHYVGVYDIRDLKGECLFNVYSNIDELLADVEYILVSTPLSNIHLVLREIKKRIVKNKVKGKVVFDIASLKWRVVNELKKFPREIAVCSIHPLFGSNITSTDREKIVVIPIEGRDDDCREVINLLQPYNFKFIYSTQEEHDMAVGYTIGLPYFIGWMYGETILERNKVIIEKFGGTSYKLLASYISNILIRDDPTFIEEIIKNPYTKEAIKEFINICMGKATTFTKEQIQKFITEWINWYSHNICNNYDFTFIEYFQA